MRYGWRSPNSRFSDVPILAPSAAIRRVASLKQALKVPLQSRFVCATSFVRSQRAIAFYYPARCPRIALFVITRGHVFAAVAIPPGHRAHLHVPTDRSHAACPSTDGRAPPQHRHVLRAADGRRAAHGRVRDRARHEAPRCVQQNDARGAVRGAPRGNRRGVDRHPVFVRDRDPDDLRRRHDPARRPHEEVRGDGDHGRPDRGGGGGDGRRERIGQEEEEGVGQERPRPVQEPRAARVRAQVAPREEPGAQRQGQRRRRERQRRRRERPRRPGGRRGAGPRGREGPLRRDPARDALRGRAVFRVAVEADAQQHRGGVLRPRVPPLPRGPQRQAQPAGPHAVPRAPAAGQLRAPARPPLGKRPERP